jgi:hypothetical protein
MWGLNLGNRSRWVKTGRPRMFLKVVLDVSSCSPWDATNFAQVLRVLHNLLAAAQPQAVAIARTAATLTPAARSVRTDSRAVTPVVTMSSTSTTSPRFPCGR